MGLIAVSYTCIRDLELLKALNKQLTSWGVEHWSFFEEREMLQAEWEYEGKKFERANGGDNGMGRDGARAKINMLKKAYSIAESLNMTPCTFVDIDSDVRFKENILNDFICTPEEFKGFAGFDLNSKDKEKPTHRVFDNQWYYATGCIKSFNSEFVRWMMNNDTDNYMPDLINHSITPSEDAFLSYLAQVPYRGTFVNMKEKYLLSVQSKDYDNDKYDIVS